MTTKQCFEACLIECNKVQAPALLLDDFNYLFNKAVQKYFNRRYALFETNQQVTDDLRALVKTRVLKPEAYTQREDQMGASYKVVLPEDYVHILNCTCEFKNLNKKCSDGCSLIRQGAHKLDSNQWSQVITNYYMRPSIRQPYFFISNIDEPKLVASETLADKQAGTRYGNTYQPIMEIKCGVLDPNQYELNSVSVDYLRAPFYIKLKQKDLDDVEDTTKLLEFPDYVIYEIINELVASMLENAKDPRIQTYPQVNTTLR